MKTKLKSILAIALCAVGLSAFAEEPEAVQLWKDGPYFATVNVGDAEQGVPAEYGALYKFNDATNEVAKLGDGWRLPTEEELEMLAGRNKGAKVCSNVWTTCNGVVGRRFFGMTSGCEDKSIFLPAAGMAFSKVRSNAGVNGYYWSSASEGTSSEWSLVFDESSADTGAFSRFYGLSVRAVRDTPPTPPEPELAVANVMTATHWPWDGKIDVTCDLTGAGNVRLSAALTTNGVTVCTAKAENVTGETEIDLDQVGGATNGVKFVWNAKADCPADFNSKDTKVKVTAKKVVPPAGALPGEFSVSADKKVHFSQGNLVATIDVSGVPAAWKFAANQYDYVGKSGANDGIGSKAGDVDLFGWSTSSNGGTSTTDNYGIKMSKVPADYSGSFYDWGKAVGDGSTWRTLSVGEWKYLIETREVNGGKGEGKSFQRATINSDATSGVFGMILFPDNYTETAKASYTSAEWTSLEKLGCVFLPAAGYRWSVYSMVMDDGIGYYWSKSEKGNADAYYLNFGSNSMRSDGSTSRCEGQSVRLVTEVK